MNKKLEDIFNDDQQERVNWKEWGKSIDTEDVKKRDNERLQAVLTMIEMDELKDALDFFHAATVLQHGDKVEHYKLANELCEKAINLGEERAKWLYAATLDRYLMNTGKKFQELGTQYKKNNKGKWELYPVDPKTSDMDRARYNVPSLENLKNQEKKLNE
jgi:hypothetical protein